MRAPSLVPALGASIAFHVLALLLLDLAIRHFVPTHVEPTPVIEARLELPAKPGPTAAVPPSRVLKDTVDPAPARPPRGRAMTAPADIPGRGAPTLAGRAEHLSDEQLSATLGRLSETLFYPPEALRRGLEGEVVVLVELGEEGRILQASVASSSGHGILDEAAVRAVHRLGSLGPPMAGRAILLPVRFRLL